MFLFFDTETTGLPSDREPLDHHSQPHIVQIAALLCADDGGVRGSFSLIVNPGDDVEVPQRAAEVHGITTERMRAEGVEPRRALALLAHFLKCADVRVAHNIKFDDWLVRIANARAWHHYDPLPGRPFCTMEAAAPIVNLPPTERMLAAGMNKPKSPNLSEAYRHFFGEELEGAHDAMADAMACRRIFFHLRDVHGVAA
jgi:DNA polymerase-3 subunit epsilon